MWCMAARPSHSTEHQVGIPTPVADLALGTTPVASHFVRSHGPSPLIDPAAYRLRVDGAVQRPLELGLDDLRERPERSLHVTLECAGHRRTEFEPAVSGLQWDVGAIGHSEWRGTPLAGILAQAGVAAEACEVVLHGADTDPFPGLEGDVPFARSIPVPKALHPDTLLVWEMAGEPLPPAHGAPLRAVVPGWYGVASVKWLVRVEVVRTPFEGPYQALDYRLKLPGEDGPGEALTEMPISALVLSPAPGARVLAGRVRASGIVWGGEGGPERVEVRVDVGPWRPARLLRPDGPWAPRHWRAPLDLEPGSHTVAVRATDAAGNVMPDGLTWNVRGYGNNAVHRVRVVAE